MSRLKDKEGTERGCQHLKQKNSTSWFQFKVNFRNTCHGNPRRYILTITVDLYYLNAVMPDYEQKKLGDIVHTIREMYYLYKYTLNNGN